MKILKTILCTAMAALLLTGCVSGGETGTTGANTEKPASAMQDRLDKIAQLGQSPDDNYRVWYEIFVYSFCDSNGDGIGDLKGVTSKLDYLQELGINGIWLMPIHPSSSYHKYNVRDYYEIDPEYGTMADFEELLAECKKRDIKLIMDLVVNHTGSDHAWFRELTEYLKFVPPVLPLDSSECKYVDYYNLAVEGGSGYRKIPGTDFYYESRFSADMPDLNLGSEAVRQEIRSIMEFWLGKGVSGFRLDAAKEFYSGNTDKNIEVLKFLQDTAVSIKPDAYMVAEVWDDFSQVTRCYESGITSLFNFPFGSSGGKIAQVIRGAGNATQVAGFAKALEKADKAYLAKNPNYIDAPFMSNHDVGRIAGFVSRNEDKTKLVGAMNLMMGGSAFIYYGEEIGMVAGAVNDPSYRAPMYWNDRRADGVTQPPPGCTLPDEYPMGSLEQQKENDHSVYNYYRQAIAIRKALPVISHGRVTEEAALNTGCISAQRKTWGEESCIILMNINSQDAVVDLSAYTDWTLTASLSVGENEVKQDGNNLSIPAYGVAVLLPK